MTDLLRDLLDACDAAHADALLAHRGPGPHERHAAALAAIRADGGEYRPAYNGWPNRETWNAHLWITNDQGLYERARELVAEELAEHTEDLRTDYLNDTPEQIRRAAISYAADALKDWWDEYNASPLTEPDKHGPLSDAWSYAVACVDWRKVAEALAE